MGVKRYPQVFLYPIVMLVALIASLWFFIPIVIKVAAIWWLFALGLVILYPKMSRTWGKGVVLRGIMGFLVLVPCWLAVNFIRNVENGPYILLFLLILIWGADSAAYFAGRLWGRRQLAPAVSPKKTWQGLGGALVSAIVITALILWLIHTPLSQWIKIMSVSLVTVLFSVLGDLFESMLKRKAGLKDSSHLLPGHGGILDRIDSLTAAAPIFLLGLEILQHF